MEQFVAYLLKMLICSAILFGYYRLALYNERFHQWNRFYLLASVMLSAIVPIIKFPIITTPQTNNLATVVNGLPWNIQVVAPDAGLSWQVIVMVMVVSISTLLVFQMLFSILGILKAYRSNPVIGLQRNISLVFTSLHEAPFSFFNWLFWRNDIDLKSDNGKRILRHEITHIRQFHSIDKMFISLMVSAFWFNPFFWLIQKEVNAIHEFLADQKAIESEDGAAFAKMILQTACLPNAANQHLVNPFFSSQIKRRLFMITTSKNPKYAYMRRLSGLAIMIFAGLMLTLSVQKSEAQQPVKKIIIKERQTAETPGKDTTIKKIKTKEINQEKYDESKAGKKTITIEKKVINGESSDIELDEENVLDAESKNPPLYILNGKEVGPDIIKELDQSTIKTIDVLKGTKATEQYGVKAANGIVKIFTGNNVESKKVETTKEVKPAQIVVRGSKNGNGTPPLFYLDGKEITTDEMNNIKPNEIESLNVLKGESATKKYGEKGKDGVIEIVMKKPITRS